MVDTIASVVRGGRPSRFAAIAHVLGATIAAAALGALLGTIGGVAGGPWGRIGTIVIASIGAILFLRDALGLPIPLPERKGQVPAWWRTFFSPGVASGLYGAVLGIGVATHLTYGTFVVACAGAFASGDPVIGTLICAPFGVVRGVVVVASALRSGSDLRAIEAQGARPVARTISAGASAVVTIAALLALF